jgi:hypothetical protein
MSKAPSNPVQLQRPGSLPLGLAVILAGCIWSAPAYSQSYDPCAALRVASWNANLRAAAACQIAVLAGGLGGDECVMATADAAAAANELAMCEAENPVVTPIVTSGPIFIWGGTGGTAPGSGGGEWVGIGCGDGQIIWAFVWSMDDVFAAAMGCACYTQ